MNDILKKVITITNIIPITDIGLRLISGEDSYSMFFTKLDKTETKANEGFLEKDLGVGSSVEVVYKEEEKEYKYKDKETGEEKTGKGINRKIMCFGDVLVKQELPLDKIDF